MRALLLLVLCAGPLAGQQASAYVPLDHWAMPYVEHLIASGVLADPTPLTRPLREADLVRALHAVDTLTTSGAVTETVRRLLAAFTSEQGAEGSHYRVDGSLGVAAATYAKRDPLAAVDSAGPRAAGPKHGYVNGGLALQLDFGPVVAVTHPYFDTRLKYDPDWFGKKDRTVAGRTAESYVSAQWRFGEVFFGRLDRNWGPSVVQGLLLSANPYGLDHLGIALGTSRVQLQAIATQLDDRDSTGARVHRYMTQHRLWHGLGPALIVAALGLVVALVRRSRTDVVLVTFVLVYFIDLMTLRAHFDRYVLPLVPPLAALAGRFRALVPVTLLLLVVPLTWTIRNDKHLTRTDTRVVAAHWIERHIPRGTRIAADPSTPQVTGLRVLSLQLPGPGRPFDENRSLDRLRRERIRLVVVSGAVTDRVTKARDRYPKESAFYGRLAESARRVYYLAPGDRYAGPWVAIYRL